MDKDPQIRNEQISEYLLSPSTPLVNSAQQKPIFTDPYIPSGGDGKKLESATKGPNINAIT